MLKITGTMMLVLMLTTLTASAEWLMPTDSDQSTTQEDYLNAETTINGNGLQDVVFHNNNMTYILPNTSKKGMMWLSESGDAIGSWIAFEFDRQVTVNTLTVWNFNDVLQLEAGIKRFRIWYTNSPLASEDWTAAGKSTLVSGTGESYYFPNTSINVAIDLPGLEGEGLTGLKLEVLETYGSLTQAGLSEIQFEVTEVPEPATMGLLAVGGLAMLRSRRRRNKK